MNKGNVALGDIFHVRSSKRVLKSQWKNEGVPFYRGREITILANNGWVDNELFISESDYANFAAKSGVPGPGDLVITAIGTIGNSYIVRNSDKFYFKDASVLWLRKVTDVNSEYINLWLKSPQFFSQLDRGNGATVDTLTIKKLQGVRVNLPPLPEQERIVAILDEAFAAIATATANAERNIANARELFESELNRIFTQKGDGWTDNTLGEVSRDFGRGKSKHRPRNAGFLYGGSYPFVQTGDVRNSEHVISTYTQTYSAAGLAQSKLWPAGTVCVTIAANIAETGILGFDACFPDSIIGMVPDPDRSDGGYVEYLLNFFKTELQRQGKGSAQDNINLGTFKEQKFPFAPLPEQQAIAAKLDCLSDETKCLGVVQRRKLTALALLKQSILHKAFTGALTAIPNAADRKLLEAGL